MTTALAKKDTQAASSLKPLELGDRCDRDGILAQAVVRVELLTYNEKGETITGDLAFCSHHFTKYEEALRKRAKYIEDIRKGIPSERSG